ncbi:uncharacterized protein LOC142176661 [Nicotiana tabacum]|uniref:Uncharacterized protein LOC142176661 n=1 Tax=Nicotiana tabacum TaxID=4097 RepID=A0AC58TUG9_TOBAC
MKLPDGGGTKAFDKGLHAMRGNPSPSDPSSSSMPQPSKGSKDIDVKLIMVDDGNGACIIHPRVLDQMRLKDKIVPRCITLTGFNNTIEQTSEEITLPVLTGGITLKTTFHIMDQAAVYNGIVGRPWIHLMRAVPSSLYQVIKFPTLWGIFSIQGEQRTSRECYYISMDSMTTQQNKDKEIEA